MWPGAIPRRHQSASAFEESVGNVSKMVAKNKELLAVVGTILSAVTYASITLTKTLDNKEIALKNLELKLAEMDAELQKRIFELAFHGDHDKFRDWLLKYRRVSKDVAELEKATGVQEVQKDVALSELEEKVAELQKKFAEKDAEIQRICDLVFPATRA